MTHGVKPKASDHIYNPKGSGQFLTEYQDGHTEPRAVLLYFHGGGWFGGSRFEDNIAQRVLPLTAGGVIVVSVDYRLSGSAQYPAQLEDAGEAYEWALDRYPQLPIFVGGASAGAHLAALVGLGAWESLVQRKHVRRPSGVITYCVVSDPLQWDEERLVQPFPATGTFAHHLYERSKSWPLDLRGKQLLGTSQHVVRPELVQHVHPGAPPFLLVHGRDDSCVHPKHSARLFEALRAEHNAAWLIELSQADHEDLQFGAPVVLAAVRGFIEQQL